MVRERGGKRVKREACCRGGAQRYLLAINMRHLLALLLLLLFSLLPKSGREKEKGSKK
jgi:hypothetical protein